MQSRDETEAFEAEAVRNRPATVGAVMDLERKVERYRADTVAGVVALLVAVTLHIVGWW